MAGRRLLLWQLSLGLRHLREVTHPYSPKVDYHFIRLANVDILSTMNVNEGATATFNVYGKFVGDQLISLTRYSVASGSTAGFLGNGQPADIPEPASAALLAGGLFAIVAIARKRQPA